MKVGLVLSGGGAKGAYQAGVVRALADAGVEVSVVSGASIGALNGGILSAATDMTSAAERLEKVWEAISDIEPLQLDHGATARYISALISLGLPGPTRLAAMLSLSVMDAVQGEDAAAERGIFKNDPLREMLHSFLKSEDLARGRELHVSLYPQSNRIEVIRDGVKSGLLKRYSNQQSIFKHVQGLPLAEQIDCLMASAAIPVLFSPIKVEGEYYTDGGQGDYRRVQGNTPISPLIGKNLDAIIVSHLSDGSLWDIEDFPGENILEIRPGDQISNGMLDVLGFDADKIREWVNAGRSDTSRVLKKVQKVGSVRNELESATENIQKPISDSSERRQLDNTLARLRVRRQALNKGD